MQAIDFPRAWPFVYTRNKTSDYAFLVLPEPFVRDTKATSGLIEAFDDGTEATQMREFAANGSTWTIFYRQHEASAAASPVLDHVGRPIIVIDGFITDRPMALATAGPIILSAYQRLERLLHLFWGVATTGPVISSATPIAVSPSSDVPYRAVPDAATSPVESIPSAPARIATAAPRPRRRERIYLWIIVMLAVAGLVTGLYVASERRKSQKQIDNLSRCLKIKPGPCNRVQLKDTAARD